MNWTGKIAAVVATAILWAYLVVHAFGADAGAVTAGQKGFATPKQAIEAMVKAIRDNDTDAMKTILGPGSETILASGDATSDREERQRFLQEYDEASKLVDNGRTSKTLVVGADEWPMPIPIVERGGQWIFDTPAGKRELLARRIGRNELFTIESCLAYVDAQREYASEDRGDGVLDYAQKFISSPGKKDGLYWPEKAGAPQSPLGPLFAGARAEGYELGAKKSGTPEAYHGYYYKILTAQGPNAKGGAYGYVVDGKMIGGFALVAYPATYGVSGNTTFIVNQDGAVFEQDLGPKTASLASSMTRFDPGTGWQRTRGALAER